jgi:hypothetical protein
VGVSPDYIYYGASRCAVDDGHIRRFPANSTTTPTPETIATLPVGGMGVAAAGDSVFFLAATAPGPIDVVSAPAAGGTATTLATDLSWAYFLLTDGANLYWNSGSASVGSVPVTGGEMVTVASAQDLASEFVGLGAVDGTNIYFLDDAGLHALSRRPNGAWHRSSAYSIG